MSKIKLQEKYGSNIKFVGRERRNDIILLNTINNLTEAWYKEKKSNFADDTEPIIKTAAKLIKNEIKNLEGIIEYCLGTEDIEKKKSKSFILPLLKTFVSIKSPLEQILLSQALFAGVEPTTIIPLQFILAVTADYQLASTVNS